VSRAAGHVVTPAPDLPVSRTLFELLNEQATASPLQEAVVTSHQRTNYGAWRDAARQVAAGLAGEGVVNDDRVALIVDNRPAWLDIAMGTVALGARITPFNTWIKPWDLEYLLGHAKPKVLFTLDRMGNQDFLAHLSQVLPELGEAPPGEWHSERFPDLRAVVVLGDHLPRGALAYEGWLGSHADGPRAVAATPKGIAAVFYTSGSTARPKAVPLLHEDLIVNGFYIGERQALSRDDRVFLASPLFWAYGGANALMAALTHGSTLVLQSQFRADEAIAILEEERCTSLYTLPAMTRALLDAPDFERGRLTSLRTGLTIGGRKDVTLAAEALGVSGICNIYGSTETYGNCCVTPTASPLEQRLDSQGPPLPGVELKIVEVGTGTTLTAGEVGEIRVRGRVTPGYLDDSGEPVRSTDEEGFFATGDLGSLDELGWLTYVGRSSEMIKSAGINISPSEVEEFLLTHPEVAEVAVLGGADPLKGEVVIAFVRLVSGATVSPADLRTFCKDRIAGYKVPAVIEVVDRLPTTATGKLARRELKQHAAEVASRVVRGAAT
jgi:fatty-acyl-CoA synthase